MPSAEGRQLAPRGLRGRDCRVPRGRGGLMGACDWGRWGRTGLHPVETRPEGSGSGRQEEGAAYCSPGTEAWSESPSRPTE